MLHTGSKEIAKNSRQLLLKILLIGANILKNLGLQYTNSSISHADLQLQVVDRWPDDSLIHPCMYASEFCRLFCRF